MLSAFNILPGAGKIIGNQRYKRLQQGKLVIKIAVIAGMDHFKTVNIRQVGRCQAQRVLPKHPTFIAADKTSVTVYQINNCIAIFPLISPAAAEFHPNCRQGLFYMVSYSVCPKYPHICTKAPLKSAINCNIQCLSPWEHSGNRTIFVTNIISDPNDPHLSHLP